MEIEKKIREQKNLHRDIFRKYNIKSSDWMDLGLALLASSVVGSWLDLFFGNDLVIAAVIFGLTAAVKRMRNNDTGGKIHPYAPTPEFMGLYCIGEIGSREELENLKNKQYRLYGWKTVAVGVLLILFSQFLMLGNFREIRLGIIDIGEVGTIMQLIAMGALLLYGYVTHMNREFFYANLEPILNM